MTCPARACIGQTECLLIRLAYAGRGVAISDRTIFAGAIWLSIFGKSSAEKLIWPPQKPAVHLPDVLGRHGLDSICSSTYQEISNFRQGSAVIYISKPYRYSEQPLLIRQVTTPSLLPTVNAAAQESRTA